MGVFQSTFLVLLFKILSFTSISHKNYHRDWVFFTLCSKMLQSLKANKAVQFNYFVEYARRNMRYAVKTFENDYFIDL